MYTLAIVPITNKRLLFPGVLYMVVGICYFVDGVRSHLSLLRIVGLSCWLLLGILSIWRGFEGKPQENKPGQPR